MDPAGRANFALLRTDGQVLAGHQPPWGKADAAADQEPAGPPVAGEVPAAVRHPSAAGPVIERLGERREWLPASARSASIR